MKLHLLCLTILLLSLSTSLAQRGGQRNGTDNNITHPQDGPFGNETNQTRPMNNTKAPLLNQTRLAQSNGPQSSNGQGDRRGGSFFGSLLFTLLIIGTFGFIASIFYYRYQIKKYRVVPFVPPSFCPKAIYPPVQETHQGTDYAYGEMELGGGDYRAPKAHPLIEC